MTDTIDDRILRAIKYNGSISAYYCKTHLGMKYDTARDHLNKMVQNGTLYTKKVGRYTYYAFAPNGNTNRNKPDIKKGEVKTEVYGRASVITRASSVSEVIEQKGFVCHPKITGADVSRSFIRCHHNGEYQVKILKKGNMAEGTQYIPIKNTDQSIVINWSFTDLSLNTSCICKIKIPSDNKKYTCRTVSTKDGGVNLLSVWIHPRYIYHVDVINTAHEEFLQQVRDILPILESQGWEFADEIAYVGEHHYAFNDSVLGGLVSNYNKTESDPYVFDHSHGTNELEVIGDKGEFIDAIMQLPTILRNQTVAICELQKQVQIVAKMQVDVISATYQNIRPMDNGSGMYG